MSRVVSVIYNSRASIIGAIGLITVMLSFILSMDVPFTHLLFALSLRFRRWFSSFVIISMLTASCCQAAEYTVAIVRDGESHYFDTLLAQFKSELEALSEGQRSLVFQENDNAGFDSKLIDSHLSAALADDTVDLVYAGGVIATEHALKRALAGLKKPVIGGALQLSDFGSDFLSENGTSSLDNYTFIASPRRVITDLEQLSELTGTQTIHVLIDESYASVLQERMDSAQDELNQQLGVSVEFVLVGDSSAATLSRLSSTAEAVYVTTLPCISGSGLVELYDGLAERNIRSLAMSGRRGVESGALLGLASDNITAVARRAALNVHFIAMGQQIDELPVYLPLEDSLKINAKTASLIGWSPDYDTSLIADFVGREYRLDGESISLIRAMRLAQTQNVDVQIAREEQVRARADVGLARSSLLPQLNGLGGTSYVRNVDPISQNSTPAYADQASLGLELKQILFNDELQTQLKSQRQIEQAAEFDAVSSELDAVEATAVAYFECLRAQELYKIERENLRLSENHYQYAKLRVEIGSADPSEVHRFEQLRVKDRATLISREADRKNALIAFNRIIGAARDTIWSFEEVQVGEQNLFFMDSYIDPIVQDAGTFMKLGSFMKLYAIDNSPELMAFDRQLAAQGMLLEQMKRSYYLPEVALSADVTHFNKHSEIAARDSESSAMLGVNVTFPLFEGHRRKYDVLRQQSTIRIVESQRERAVQQLEEFVMVSFNDILSAHPNIRLNRRALDSAEKNYTSIREKYAQGSASILDLLDAQETLLSQRQSAAIALYDYLVAIHRLQRSIAWFEYQQTNLTKQSWADLFQKYLNENP